MNYKELLDNVEREYLSCKVANSLKPSPAMEHMLEDWAMMFKWVCDLDIPDCDNCEYAPPEERGEGD